MSAISEDPQVYAGVSQKGRLRKPTAKILANGPATVPIWKHAQLVLQSAVAEVVMNDSESEMWLEARPGPYNVSMFKKVIKEEKPVVAAVVMEETKVEDDGTGSVDSSTAHTHDDGVNESSMALSSPEVKRKRGRPFKGQEKPIADRVMIETSKLRRLLDDMLRKTTESAEFCIKLRTITRDLDELMTTAPVSMAAAEDISNLPDSIAHMEDVVEP
jgi:hypothetical protein